MSVTVVTKEEHELALKRIADLERTVAEIAKGTGNIVRADMSPREVAKFHRVGNDVVYAALESGRLKAEQRPGGRHGRIWRIKPADAQAWYAAFILNKSDR